MSRITSDEEIKTKINELMNGKTLKNKMSILNSIIRTYETKDQIHICFELISDMLNKGRTRDMVEVLFEELKREHPTLQQLFIRFLFDTLIKYAELSYFDGRNEYAVKTCKELKKLIDDRVLNVFLPLI